MHFGYTDDLEEFRLSVRGFFDQRLPHAQLPALLEREDATAEMWQPMAHQLGLPGLTIPEEYGGGGYGMVELALVLEEAGRALVPEPLFSTLHGVAALQIAGDADSCAAILPDVAAGRRTLAAALTDDKDDPVRAHRGSGDGWRIRGTKIHVLAGQLADTLIAFAGGEDGVSVFGVASGATQIEPVQSLDPTHPQAIVTFNDADAALVGELGDGERVARELGVAGALCLAAEQLGGADRCLEIAVEHAKQREQFGRPIGSFQAVKHHCADMLVRVESARTAVLYAAWAWDQGAEDRIVSAAVAKAAATDAYWDNARMCIQVLGGIGFTHEHPAQLHFKRATATGQMFGSTAALRESVAAHMIDSLEVPR